MFVKTNKELKKSRLDFTLLLVTVLLLAMGTVAVMSAVSDLSFGSRIIRTQIFAIAVSSVVFLFGWSFNYQIYRDQWKILYAGIIIVLIAVLIFGTADRGAKSWFKISFFSVQPVEICRIALILVLGAYLDINFNRIKKASVIMGALAIVIAVFLLIMKQPDFSSLIVTFPAVIIMIYCAGANLFYLSLIAVYGFIAILFPILWILLNLHPHWFETSVLFQNFYSLSHFGLEAVVFCIVIFISAYGLWWFFDKFKSFISKGYFLGLAMVVVMGFFSGMWAYGHMKDYQKKRVEVFLAPHTDPKGAGYNLMQAKIAVGSGGIIGKGIFSGTQSRLGFVPEKHTDFIMSVIGEELGFLGSAAILFLYLIFLWRILKNALSARDRFGYFICCGFFSMFSVYLFINLGMNLGIVPIAGLPLPFVSYGGSNLVASLWAAGLVQSVYARRMAIV